MNIETHEAILVEKCLLLCRLSVSSACSLRIWAWYNFNCSYAISPSRYGLFFGVLYRAQAVQSEKTLEKAWTKSKEIAARLRQKIE